MNNIRPILNNAKRVEFVDTAPRGQWWLTHSRERRARIHDALAVLLLWAVMALLGCAVLMLSAPAKADAEDDRVAVAYAARNSLAICEVLSDYPTVAGVMGIGKVMLEQGLTSYQAGEAMYISVHEVCPMYLPVLHRFIDTYAPQSIA